MTFCFSAQTYMDVLTQVDVQVNKRHFQFFSFSLYSCRFAIGQFDPSQFGRPLFGPVGPPLLRSPGFLALRRSPFVGQNMERRRSIRYGSGSGSGRPFDVPPCLAFVQDVRRTASGLLQQQQPQRQRIAAPHSAAAADDDYHSDDVVGRQIGLRSPSVGGYPQQHFCRSRPGRPQSHSGPGRPGPSRRQRQSSDGRRDGQRRSIRRRSWRRRRRFERSQHFAHFGDVVERRLGHGHWIERQFRRSRRSQSFRRCPGRERALGFLRQIRPEADLLAAVGSSTLPPKPRGIAQTRRSSRQLFEPSPSPASPPDD